MPRPWALPVESVICHTSHKAAPGAQLVIYPLASRGISLGTAMRVVTVGFIILGSVGWVFWFNLFNLTKWVLLTAGLHLKWLSAPWITALSALALADGYSLLSYIFLHPVHGLLQQEWPICLIGLPGGILLFVLLYRRRGERGSGEQGKG